MVKPNRKSARLRSLRSARSEKDATVQEQQPSTSGMEKASRVKLDSLVAPVRGDMEELDEMLRSTVGEEDPSLKAAADKLFGTGGKRLRPTLVFLVSRATSLLSGKS